jgi:hypothetical protein
MRVWGLSKKGANYGPAPTPDVRCAPMPVSDTLSMSHDPPRIGPSRRDDLSATLR